MSGAIAATACLVAAGAGIADTTNTDPTGDAKGGAPDITQVVTSNDAAGVHHVPDHDRCADHRLVESSVSISTPTRIRPPEAAAAEYRLIAGTGGFGILKWNGADFANATAPSLTMTRSANVVEFKINRSDIGSISRFGFAVFTVNFDAAGRLSRRRRCS